jgi:GNAT superfamily N-acetyltransferase
MFSIEKGIPGPQFFGLAWESEPLTKTLNQANGDETDVGFTLPFPDTEISYIAKDEGKIDIGQCSANKAVKYWKHVEHLDASEKNRSTQIFTAIHKKAVEVESLFLKEAKLSEDTAYHNAGIAILPEHRQKGIATALTHKQIQLCKEIGATSLFCETTNKLSAMIMDRLGFTKIAEFSYSTLALELKMPVLEKLNDSFSVWCLKI